MNNREVDKFVTQVSQATGIGIPQINRGNAEYLWRLMHRHGILVPPQIDGEVLKYLRGGYVPRYRASRSFEDWTGASVLEMLVAPVRRMLGYEELDESTSLFLRDPKIVEYLTQQ